VVTQRATPAVMSRAPHPTIDLPCTSKLTDPVGAGLAADRRAVIVTTRPTLDPAGGEALMATLVVRKVTE
jgi:hypothetical protein